MSRFLTLVGLSILFSWFYNVDCHATYFGIRQCDKGESYMLSLITIEIFKQMSVTTNHFKLIYINIFMNSPLQRASSIKWNRLSFQKNITTSTTAVTPLHSWPKKNSKKKLTTSEMQPPQHVSCQKEMKRENLLIRYLGYCLFALLLKNDISTASTSY